MIRLWVLSALLGLLLSPALAVASTSVTLQLKWKHAFQFAGYYMALEKGYYRDEGLAVTLLEGLPGQDATRFVVEHEHHYAVTDSGALLARSHGQPIKVLAAIFQHSPLALMVLQRSSIKSVTDLRGKRVMLQAGYQSADLLAMLKVAGGLTRDDLQLQDNSFNIQDLIDGKTDAFSVYLTDQPHLMDQMGIPYRIFYPRDYGIDYYGDLMITSERETKHHPKQVEAMTRATIRGWNYALDHIDEAIALILRKYNSQHLSSAHLHFEAERSVGLIMRNLVPVGFMNVHHWRHIARVYADQGLMQADFAVDAMLYHPARDLKALLLRYGWQSAVLLLLLLVFIAVIAIVVLRRVVRLRTARLAESEQNYRVLVELADVGIVVHREGRLLFANRCALGWFGKGSLDDMTDCNLLDYIHPDERKAAKLRIGQMMAQDKPFYHVPLHLVNMSAGEMECELNARLIQYQGAPAALALMIDVTDRNKVIAEREQMQQQVEHTQRLESLGVLSGGIAHDFNNLLTAILGNASLALGRLDQDPCGKRYLERIVQSSESGADLCRQMLAYAGKGQMRIEQVHIAKLFSDMTQLLEVSISRKVALHYDFDAHLPVILCDIAQMKQIMMNLVINASEAVGDDVGDIYLSAGVRDVGEDEIHRSLHSERAEPGRFVGITVRDTGCGMDAETVGRIFDPFFTTKFTGRGLGMSAILGIVNSLHGMVDIDSKPGEGTCITVLFPVDDCQLLPSLSDPDQEAAVDMPSQGAVLVVDDDPIVREVVATVLREDVGVEVIEAANGEQGLAAYQQRQDGIALVMLDLTMPVMDGAETFLKLCALNPEVKVLISSGYSEDDVRQRFADRSPSGFLTKPYRPEALIQKIRAVLAQ